MAEGVRPSAGCLAHCLPGTVFFPFSVITWDSGKGQVAAQAWELPVAPVGTPRLQGQHCPSLPSCMQHCHCSVVLQARGTRACRWKTQYPVDLFFLPVLLQEISDEEREHGNHFYLTFSLCWVNAEEDGGTE